MRRTWLVAVVAIVAVSCRKTDALVVVTVAASDNAPVRGIASLKGTVTVGSQTRSIAVPTGGSPFDLPPSRTFAVDVPPSLSGSFNLHLEARDGAGTLLAVGDASTAISPGHRVDIPLTLGASGPNTDVDMASNDIGQGSCDGSIVEACGPACLMCPAPAANGSPACTAGACNFNCDSGYVRLGTTCVQCGALGQVCCAAGTCTGGGYCNPSSVCAKPWSAVTLPSTSTINGLWAAAPNDWYAVDLPGTVYHSTGSATFTAAANLSTGGLFNLHGVWGSAANDVYVAGYDGGTPSGPVVKRSTGGASGPWNTVTNVASVGPNGIWGFDAGNIFVVGAGSGGTNAFVEKSTGGGAAFVQQTLPGGSGLYRVWGATATDLWAVGVGQTLLHYTTANGWQTITPPAGANTLWAVGGSSTSDVYVGGDNAFIAHWNGTSWQRVTLPPSLNNFFFTSIWASAPNDVYAVANGGIAHFDGAGWSPQLLPSGSPANPSFYMVWGTGPNDIYASGDAGFIVHHP